RSPCDSSRSALHGFVFMSATPCRCRAAASFFVVLAPSRRPRDIAATQYVVVRLVREVERDAAPARQMDASFGSSPMWNDTIFRGALRMKSRQLRGIQTF